MSIIVLLFVKKFPVHLANKFIAVLNIFVLQMLKTFVFWEENHKESVYKYITMRKCQ
jgi:hypothetical protein